MTDRLIRITAALAVVTVAAVAAVTSYQHTYAAGIVATVGANLAHGVGHGPVGALISA